MVATMPLIGQLEERPDITVTTPGEYNERLQVSPNLVGLAPPTVNGTAYVTQNQDYEQDFESD